MTHMTHMTGARMTPIVRARSDLLEKAPWSVMRHGHDIDTIISCPISQP
jgi:hypothetical protein